MDRDTNPEIDDSVPAVEQRRLLLGFLHENEAIERLQSSRIVATPGDALDGTENEEPTTDPATAYADLWKSANDSITPSRAFEDGAAELVDLPDEAAVAEHVDAFVNDPHFQASRGGQPADSWAIKLVPIESLVAFQPAVTQTAYETDLASTESVLDLLEFTLPVDDSPLVEDQRINDTFFSGWQFVTRSPNVHMSGPQYARSDNDDDTTIATVSFDLKSNPNFVYVAHFEDRYILKNGYHRVYQLLKAGETHVPAVVIEAESYDETGAEQAGFFDRELVMGERPPLLTDYETPAAVTISRRTTNRIVRVIAETTDVFR
ncbi:hypothetical protein [Halococcus thailandensis]|uniref:Uncharacterized protein n=1 Tax=Halococcus thailandensis JCM 13552 TaxID=1227457 RepID=M0ND39_9EURY|nr:hypothetical protein [Halococcus thailandensis]EMA54585.1 hypothetical protein C451_06290 [Halococcus thailandensis JCM 13552]